MGFDNQRPEDLLIPLYSNQENIEFTPGITTSIEVVWPYPFKALSLVSDGPLKFNGSYGANPGDLTGSTTDRRTRTHPGGGASRTLIQGEKMDRLYILAPSPATITAEAYIGRGFQEGDFPSQKPTQEITPP